MGKYETRKRRSVSSRTFIMLLALVLVIGCAVGGTVAWLVSSTDPVVNTFTYGDINITLEETKPDNKQAKIIPGVDIAKDPKVTVVKGSEACWLFVKVEEANWPTPTETVGTNTVRKVNYAIADGWTKLTGVDSVDNVYYREVSADDAKTGKDFYVLKGDDTHPNGVVTVSENLTKEEIKDITTQPTLTFTAYASQLHKNATTEFTAAEAWANVNPTHP